MSFKLAQLLTQAEVLTEDEMDAIFARRQQEGDQGLTLDAALQIAGHLSPKQANEYLAQAFRLDTITAEDIDKRDPGCLSTLTAEQSELFHVFPHHKDDEGLHLLVSLPLHRSKLQQLEEMLETKLILYPVAQVYIAQLQFGGYGIEAPDALLPLIEEHRLSSIQMEAPSSKSVDPLSGLPQMDSALSSLDDLLAATGTGSDTSATGGSTGLASLDDLLGAPSNPLGDLSSLLGKSANTPAVPQESKAETEVEPADDGDTGETQTETAPPTTATPTQGFTPPATLNLHQLEFALEGTKTRDAVVDLGMYFCASHLESAGLFIVRKQKVQGRNILAQDPIRQVFKLFQITLGPDTIFKTLQDSLVPYTGGVPQTSSDQGFFALFDPAPETVYFFPIRLKGRTVAYLYGHLSQGRLSQDDYEQMIRATHRMTQALEHVIVAMKRGIREDDEGLQALLSSLEANDQDGVNTQLENLGYEAPALFSEFDDDDDLFVEAPEMLTPLKSSVSMQAMNAAAQATPSSPGVETSDFLPIATELTEAEPQVLTPAQDETPLVLTPSQEDTPPPASDEQDSPANTGTAALLPSAAAETAQDEEAPIELSNVAQAEITITKEQTGQGLFTEAQGPTEESGKLSVSAPSLTRQPTLEFSTTDIDAAVAARQAELAAEEAAQRASADEADAEAVQEAESLNVEDADAGVQSFEELAAELDAPLAVDAPTENNEAEEAALAPVATAETEVTQDQEETETEVEAQAEVTQAMPPTDVNATPAPATMLPKRKTVEQLLPFQKAGGQPRTLPRSVSGKQAYFDGNVVGAEARTHYVSSQGVDIASSLYIPVEDAIDESFFEEPAVHEPGEAVTVSPEASTEKETVEAEIVSSSSSHKLTRINDDDEQFAKNQLALPQLNITQLFEGDEYLPPEAEELPSGVQSLVDALNTDYPKTWQTALRAIEAHHPALRALIYFTVFPSDLQRHQITPDGELKDENPEVRSGLVWKNLLQIPDQAVLGAVRQLYRRNRQARIMALRMMQQLPCEDVLLHVFRQMLDLDPVVARQSARVASRYRGNDTFHALVQWLQQQLQNEMFSQLHGVIRILSLLRVKSAIPHLIERLEHPDPEVSSLALNALIELTKQDLPHHYKKWKKWWTKTGLKTGRIDWLISGLQQSNEEIMQSSIRELIELTGEDFGFDPGDGKRQRNAAIKQWKTWRKQNPSA